MVLKNKRKQQILHNSNGGVGEDKISKLPNELIHHILSLLPIKYAMSTCILSKRWKCVSNSIPTLNFRDWRTAVAGATKEERQLKTQLFMDFLDTVLYVHEKPNIQKFNLTQVHHFDQSRVTKWIGNVIKRKVEELFLSGESRTHFKFPLSLFTCDSLTVLDLDSLTFNVPTMVSFPRLKLVRLRFITFTNGIMPNHLLSSCSILEELSLRCCSGFQSEVLCIASPALKHLCIWHCNFGESTVKISAPNLSTISCRLDEPTDFVIDSLPSLVKADIGMYFSDKLQIKLFRKLSNVKHLKIFGVHFLVQSEADIVSTCLPAFNSLIHLEVAAHINCKRDGADFMRSFFGLLQLPPNLASIVFSQSIHIHDEAVDGCWPVDPKCSLLPLKSIKFRNFEGELSELNAIKLFLKYARFLETITIVANQRLSEDHKEQLQVTKLLLMFPRPTNCVIKFLTRSEESDNTFSASVLLF